MFTKKTLIAFLGATAVVFSAGFALAEEERPQHYEAEKPATAEAALSLLNEKMPLVEDALQQEKFEKIHEVSYSMEAAVDKLRAGPKTKDRNDVLDELDAAVQTIHYASEKRDTKTLKDGVPALKEAISKTERLY